MYLTLKKAIATELGLWDRFVKGKRDTLRCRPLCKFTEQAYLNHGHSIYDLRYSYHPYLCRTYCPYYNKFGESCDGFVQDIKTHKIRSQILSQFLIRLRSLVE